MKHKKPTTPQDQEDDSENQEHFEAFRARTRKCMYRDIGANQVVSRCLEQRNRAQRSTGKRLAALQASISPSSLEAVLELIVIIVLLLLLFGTFPVFPYSRSWGYAPTGTLGTVLLIVVILYLLKVI